MAAGFFSTLGAVMLFGGPIAALFFSGSTGMPIAAMLAGSSVGTAITLFAIAVIIDRLDKLVAATKAT
ncbi:MAG: hypothetical protein KL801_12600 [Mesorhizobium sp.]|nr:hypothetical protein [Mesorhizobium sp.]